MASLETQNPDLDAYVYTELFLKLPAECCFWGFTRINLQDRERVTQMQFETKN
jgi:hypothetical protein